jgi:uncharacterized protein YjiS (DUF1127 family)
VACAAIVAALQQKPWCSAHWNLNLLISPALRRELAGERTQKNVHIDRSPYHAWERHETVRRELWHLTDRELADIGITRSDIDRIASAEARD